MFVLPKLTHEICMIAKSPLPRESSAKLQPLKYSLTYHIRDLI